MTEGALIQSVYKDYPYYRVVASSQMGVNNPFVEDVIADCCIKVIERIRNGSTKIEHVSCSGNINKAYFAILVRNKAIDWKRLKKNNNVNIKASKHVVVS